MGNGDCVVEFYWGPSSAEGREVEVVYGWKGGGSGKAETIWKESHCEQRVGIEALAHRNSGGIRTEFEGIRSILEEFGILGNVEDIAVTAFAAT